ncbi:MAG: PEPxxWA-CTERM sorting domain-containing protein [Sphingomonadaceae bacterium]
MKKSYIAASAVLLVGSSAGVASVTNTSMAASGIPGLCNTGTTADCGTTASPGGADQNWSLSSNASNTAYDGASVNGNWLANDSTSLWLTPSANGNQSFDSSSNGFYSYGLNFDLSGFDPSTASFAGRFAVDNMVNSIMLNGVALAATGGSFGSWTDFSASSGFVSGLNTLTFNVENSAQASGNPTGLRVEFTQSSVAAVPEPAVWALMIVGFGFIGMSLRRSKPRRLAFAA